MEETIKPIESTHEGLHGSLEAFLDNRFFTACLNEQ